MTLVVLFAPHLSAIKSGIWHRYPLLERPNPAVLALFGPGWPDWVRGCFALWRVLLYNDPQMP